MSDIDTAINRCKRLETLLQQKLGATGRGLHEKVSSVEDRLPPPLVRKLRLVATVRNKIVHEADYQKIEDRDAFLRASKEAEKHLNSIGRVGSGGWKAVAIGLAVIVIILIALTGRWRGWW